MIKDLFGYSGELQQIQVETGVDLELNTIEFAVAKELTTNTIITLSSANTSQIETMNVASGVVKIKFTPNTANGFLDDSNLVYQVRSRNNSSNTSIMIQEGRIFITPSLFDDIN